VRLLCTADIAVSRFRGKVLCLPSAPPSLDHKLHGIGIGTFDRFENLLWPPPGIALVLVSLETPPDADQEALKIAEQHQEEGPSDSLFLLLIDNSPLSPVDTAQYISRLADR
jgi:hypothetical protein